MQIYALDDTAVLIHADKANKHQDYFCVECQQTIRLRRGLHRKPHYYHVQPNRICRLNGKSMPHLMLQYFLKKMLPEGEVEIECQFPSIARIADVVWHPKRLVYEIQCSPITAEEVKARNASYASIGYQVIWILHDDRYNKVRLSAAEDFLAGKPHYFSNMNAEGEGVIYDQFSAVVNGRRAQRLPALPVNVAAPNFLTKNQHFQKLPFVLRDRAKMLPLIFSGDTIDCYLNRNDNNENAEFFKFVEKFLPYDKKVTLLFLLRNKKALFRRFIINPYQSLVKLILERACR